MLNSVRIGNVKNNLLSRLNRFKVEMLIGFALAFISQTQIRFMHVPFGLGELILMMLICASAYVNIRTGAWRDIKKASYKHVYINAFPFILLFITILSSLVWISKYQPVNIAYMKHNLASYLFCAFSFVFFLQRTLTLRIVALSFVFILLALLCLEFFMVPSTDYFYCGIRLRGLSENPNQLAFYLLLAPIILVNAYKMKMLTPYVFLPLFILMGFLIYFIHSSAYFVGYFAALVVFLGCLFFYHLNISRAMKRNISIICILLLALGLGYVIFQHHTVTPKHGTDASIQKAFSAKSFAIASPPSDAPITTTDMTSIGNIKASSQRPLIDFDSEASVRFQLWTEAIQTVALSPFIGLGAGAGVLAVGTGNFSEVHNQFLDLSVQSGLIGLLLYLVFLCCILSPLIRRKENMMPLLMYTTVLVFSFFHFIYRQPVFWFYLAYILQITDLPKTNKKREDKG